MVASKLGTEDITNIGMYGRLKVSLPSYAMIESVKNIVTRVKARYPREDGLTYTTSVDKKTNTIMIEVVKPENVRRRNLDNG